MKTGLTWILGTVVVTSLWGAANFVAMTQGWFLDTLAAAGNTNAFVENVSKRINNDTKGNAVMLMMEQGNVVAHHHISVGRPVNETSVFGVASLGKWVAAVGAMKLAQEGKLDLDAPVSQYLTRWQLPESQYDNNGVTVRRLLSHTAGITDGLGHDGFAPGTPVQPLVEHLTLAADREPDKSGRVEVGIEPGTEWKYSGGSYNLLQLIIEEVTGQHFSDYMQQAVFNPLGMKDTTYFVDRTSSQTAAYYGDNQVLQTYPNYTSLAATGLYSTTTDLAKFVRSQIPSSVLVKKGPRILSDETILAMHQPLGNAGGLDIWGAGVMLFADNNQGSFVIGHGGRSPRLNATARFNPATGNAFIMIQTGNQEAFASDMATQWTNWEVGTPDMYQLRHLIPQMITRVIAGTGVIVLVAIIGFVVMKRRKKHLGTSQDNLGYSAS